MYNISGIGQIRESIWFTSDTFFYNESMMDMLARPFPNVSQMNEYIIKKWNAVVSPRDIVYHLGNFAMGSKSEINELLDRLNGRINLIVGSEDSNNNILSFRKKLASVNYRLDFQIDNWRVTLNHYPQRFWFEQHKGSIHLHGYICGTVPADQYSLCLDVGMDSNNFRLHNWEDIKEVMIMKSEYIEFQKHRVADYL